MITDLFCRLSSMIQSLNSFICDNLLIYNIFENTTLTSLFLIYNLISFATAILHGRIAPLFLSLSKKKKTICMRKYSEAPSYSDMTNKLLLKELLRIHHIFSWWIYWFGVDFCLFFFVTDVLLILLETTFDCSISAEFRFQMRLVVFTPNYLNLIMLPEVRILLRVQKSKLWMK